MHSLTVAPQNLRPVTSRLDFARRGFRYAAPAVWNSLTKTVLKSPILTFFFKFRLKTFLFDLAFSHQLLDLSQSRRSYDLVELQKYDDDDRRRRPTTTSDDDRDDRLIK